MRFSTRLMIRQMADEERAREKAIRRRQRKIEPAKKKAR